MLFHTVLINNKSTSRCLVINMSQTPETSFKTSKLFRALSAQASINCSKFSLVSVSNCFPSKRLWEILRKKNKEQITFNWKMKGERYMGKASQGDQPYFSLTLTSLSDFKTVVFFRVAGVPPPFQGYVHVPVLLPKSWNFLCLLLANIHST